MDSRKKAAEMSRDELAAFIDHSVLKPEFTQDDIKKQILLGIAYKCKTVCINPSAVPIAKELCTATATKICVVCDFPFGLSSTSSKALQAHNICREGDVFELDMVANYGWIRSGLWDRVRDDISAVVTVCQHYNTKVKTIIETDALTIDEVLQATECCIEAGSHFVKTSTGFFTGERIDGATIEVVNAIIAAADGRCKVKGAGGIRTREKFLSLIDAGIDRMGIGYRSTPVVLGVT